MTMVSGFRPHPDRNSRHAEDAGCKCQRQEEDRDQSKELDIVPLLKCHLRTSSSLYRASTMQLVAELVEISLSLQVGLANGFQVL